MERSDNNLLNFWSLNRSLSKITWLQFFFLGLWSSLVSNKLSLMELGWTTRRYTTIANATSTANCILSTAVYQFYIIRRNITMDTILYTCSLIVLVTLLICLHILNKSGWLSGSCSKRNFHANCPLSFLVLCSVIHHRILQRLTWFTLIQVSYIKIFTFLYIWIIIRKGFFKAFNPCSFFVWGRMKHNTFMLDWTITLLILISG